MNNILRIMRNLTYRHQVYLYSTFRIQKSCRSFHNSTKLYVKMFMEHENRYAYNIMENKGYAISLDNAKENKPLSKEQFDKLLQEDWSKIDPQQLFDILPVIGTYCSQHGLCISNKIFDDFIDNLTNNIKYANDEELKSIFHSLTRWPETESIRTRNYIEVWVALDDECLNRIKFWSFDEMLSFVSLFFMLNVTRVSNFSVKCLQKLANKAKQLTPAQLVQTFFFIGVFRRSPFDMHNLEIQLNHIFHELTVEELSIIAMGFFKSKTPIRNMDLVSQIIDKVTDNSKYIHDVSLAALLKVIRYSMKITGDNRIYTMLNALQSEIPRLSIMCNVHIALVGTATLTLHKECLSKIAENVIGSISKTRLKDLERLVLTFGIFSVISDTKQNFFQAVIDELRKPERAIEIETYGRVFACCIAYLTLLDIYPVDLMSKVLSPEFLEKAYGKRCFSYGREVLTVHNAALIFCADAKMNRLSDKIAIVLAKKFTDYVPNEDYQKQFNITEKMMLDIMTVLKEYIGGDKYVTGNHILTHHQRGDVIICKNKNGQYVPLAEKFNDKSFGLLQKPPDDNYWIVLVIAGRNSMIRNSDQPTGPFMNKVKELKALGFHAALVPWSIYSKLQTKEEKFHYLTNLIKSAAEK